MDEECETKINNYSEKVHSIKKEDFANAISLFRTLILFFENEKEDREKNKKNRNNLVIYL